MSSPTPCPARPPRRRCTGGNRYQRRAGDFIVQPSLLFTFTAGGGCTGGIRNQRRAGLSFLQRGFRRHGGDPADLWGHSRNHKQILFKDKIFSYYGEGFGL